MALPVKQEVLIFKTKRRKLPNIMHNAGGKWLIYLYIYYIRLSAEFVPESSLILAFCYHKVIIRFKF